MAKAGFGEALAKEWESVDPDNWMVEPQEWLPRTRRRRRYLPIIEPEHIEGDLLAAAMRDVEIVISGFSYRPTIQHGRRESTEKFEGLADEWRRETILDSSIQRRVMHRAYQQIIGMGATAVPLIIARLTREPDHWFWALTAITGEDPAAGETTLDGARARWLEWAAARGL